jgi:anti-sigma regulatory factor (Ser/Thr protein kinase)
VTGGLSFSALQRAGSPVRLWQPQGRFGTMNTLADCAIARHGDEVSSASITLQPALTAPGQVRTFTRQSLYRWGEEEQLIETAVRVVSEPVTNAVRHGGRPPSPGRRCERIRLSLITLTLTRHPDALRAEVRDGSGILPVQRSAGREDDCGRGLAIIDALAEYWTPGRAPRGGKWVRACMSGGNGLFDGGR